MKIIFNTQTIRPMMEWLSNRKKKNIKDEKRLMEILSMSDYQIEFQRYAMKNLPVCGITKEEAIDFFMNFDQKDFTNQRLQTKKPFFEKFYHNLENQMNRIDFFTSLERKDEQMIQFLLENSFPKEFLKEIDVLNIILIVSIGNSMGWPFSHYIDYDISNFDLFTSKEEFLHVTAHEIHHILFNSICACENIKPEEYFLLNFAFEGLAVHYNNNLATLYKPSKYHGQVYGMNQEDMQFYETHFEEILTLIRQDYEKSKTLTLMEVENLIASHYEQFSFQGHLIQQYPTYYFGCYLWGLIDVHFGKEKVLEILKNPSLFILFYNQVAQEKYRF